MDAATRDDGRDAEPRFVSVPPHARRRPGALSRVCGVLRLVGYNGALSRLIGAFLLITLAEHGEWITLLIYA